MDATSVVIADVIPLKDKRVSDIDYWVHPTLPFNSLIITASDDGLKAFDFEYFSEVSTIKSDASLASIHVVYQLYRDNASGARNDSPSNVQAYAVTSNQSGPAINFYEIDNTSRQFKAFGSLNVPDIKNIDKVCGGNIENDALALFVISDDKFIALDLEKNSVDKFIIKIMESVSHRNGVDCTVDPSSARVWTASKDGGIFLFSDGRLNRIHQTDYSIMALDLTPRAPLDNEPSFAVLDEPSVQKASLTSGSNTAGVLISVAHDNGLITLISPDGDSRGRYRFSGSFDYVDHTASTAFGMGFGNFGAVYRGGAVAVAGPGPAYTENGLNDPSGRSVDNSSASYVRIVPWNSVLSALSLPVEFPLNPRAPYPIEEDDGVLNINPTFGEGK
ncbi:MAG: hypothetical protein AAF720_09330 [Pseudomonadota bacterium]